VLTLTLDSTVVVGTYTIVVRGNAAGQDEQTVEITLVVAASSGVAKPADGLVRAEYDESFVFSLTQAGSSARMPRAERGTAAFATKGALLSP
jgi:hypothetical protein